MLLCLSPPAFSSLLVFLFILFLFARFLLSFWLHSCLCFPFCFSLVHLLLLLLLLLPLPPSSSFIFFSSFPSSSFCSSSSSSPWWFWADQLALLQYRLSLSSVGSPAPPPPGSGTLHTYQVLLPFSSTRPSSSPPTPLSLALWSPLQFNLSHCKLPSLYTFTHGSRLLLWLHPFCLEDQ